MSVYNVKCYRREGGDAIVVASGGKIVMQTGSQLVPDSETQAAAIADVSTATIAWTTGDKAKVNSIIAVLEGIGAVAT